MNKATRSIFLSVLLAVVGLAGVAAPMRGTAAREQAAPAVIRVGYFPNITHAQAVLGFGAGLFTRALPGVDVRGTVFNAGPDELTALFAGAIDIAYIGPGPAINGYIRSHGGLYVVAGAATGGSLLVARSGSGIARLSDLAGKKVGIPQIGNTQDILLRSLLKDHGLAPSDQGGSVRVLAVQNPDTLPLFTRGEIDAALVPEPWGSRLVAATGAHIVLDWRQIYNGATPATVIVVSAPFLKAHPDLVVRFLRVHDQATRLLANPASVRAALNHQIKVLTGKALPDAVLAAALSRTLFSTAINAPALSRFAGFSKAAGYLPKSADVSGLVDVWPLAHLHDASIK